jgi:hypothetical protein
MNQRNQSAGAVLANQVLWGGVKVGCEPLFGHGPQLLKSQTPPLARVAAAGLLQVSQGLLAEAAVVTPGPELQQLMQRFRAVANLQRGHGLTPKLPPTLRSSQAKRMQPACITGLLSRRQQSS